MKKTRLVPGYRVTEEEFKAIQKMIESLKARGWDFVALRRLASKQVADMFARGEEPFLPFRIMTKKEAEILDALERNRDSKFKA